MTSPPLPLLDLLRRDLADQYRIDGELGSGATATVYRAFDLKHARAVAIKLLRPDLAASLTAERFMREINIAAQLQHPHILPMLDSGRAGGSFYFVMPLVEGETLRERLRRAPPLSVGEAVRIMVDLADALSYAHRHGVVHRDIKPDNIMLTGRHAVVMDFGVAKALNRPDVDPHLTRGVAIGTPAYMAPEQATAAPTDHRADLYALGIVGYEMLTGSPPFIGTTPQQVLTAQVVLTPEPVRSRRSDIPGQVADTIERCLAKQPEDRWQTAGEVLERLDSFATPSGGLTPAALAKPRRRMFPVAVVVGAVAVAMLLWDLRLRSGAGAAPTVRPERLSFLGTVREAAPSPEGGLLAYITADTAGQTLWVQDVASAGRPIQLARSERIVGVAWTNGGADLSFTEGPAERPVIRMVPRLGGSATVVGNGRGILSPDGRQLLVATGSDPNLLVIRRSQNDTVRLKRPGEGWLSGIAWSPHSDRLAATILAADKAGSIVVSLGLDGSIDTLWSDERQLYGPAWAPNAESLYLLASGKSGKDLLRLDSKGRAPRTLAVGLTVVDESRRQPTGTFLAVSAKGDRAVFVEEEQWSNLARFAVDGTDPGARPAPVLFTMGTALYTSARLSPDGRFLAAYVSTARGISVGTVPIDGNEVSEIGVVDVAGEIAWAPDGMAIAYTGNIADSGTRLSVYQRSTGSTRRSPVPVGMEISWGASGIVAQQPGNHGLLLIDPRALTATAVPLGDSALTVFVPRVSPSGDAIAMLSYRGSTGPVSLSRFDRLSRRIEPVLAGAYRPLRWSADDQTLYAVRNTFAPAPEAVMAIVFDGSKPRIIATLPAGFVSEDLSGDGRTLIATQLQSRSEAYHLALPKP